jgi:hypothetical protein
VTAYVFVVGPDVHVYVNAPLAVKVAVFPTQIPKGPGGLVAMANVGAATVVIPIVAAFVQPSATPFTQ